MQLKVKKIEVKFESFLSLNGNSEIVLASVSFPLANTYNILEKYEVGFFIGGGGGARNDFKIGAFQSIESLYTKINQYLGIYNITLKRYLGSRTIINNLNKSEVVKMTPYLCKLAEFD